LAFQLLNASAAAATAALVSSPPISGIVPNTSWLAGSATSPGAFVLSSCQTPSISACCRKSVLSFNAFIILSSALSAQCGKHRLRDLFSSVLTRDCADSARGYGLDCGHHFACRAPLAQLVKPHSARPDRGNL